MNRSALGALCGALLFCTSAALAAGIAVNPIRMELPAGQRSTTLTLTNDSDETKVLQASMTRWTQVNGESVYEPAMDLIATPALFRIAPKAKQLVRVGYMSAAPDATVEQTYRLFIEEVPEGISQGNQIRFLLRFGIPLFVPPAQPNDSLQWQLKRLEDGRLLLQATNSGNRHVRLQSMQLGTGENLIVKHQELVYVLAGGRQQWTFVPAQPVASDARLHLHAESGRGALDADLSISNF